MTSADPVERLLAYRWDLAEIKRMNRTEPSSDRRETPMSEPKLTPGAVDEIMRACLFTADEVAQSPEPLEMLVIEGIAKTYGFHPGRISEYASRIGDLLAELPLAFRRTHGGGWSFLNACDDRDGNQWTGLHVEMEALFCLGIAAGKARWLVDRDMWSAFPGGMPYVVIDPEGFPKEERRQ